MIDINDISLLDWHKTRILDFIPEHFVRVKFRHDNERLQVIEWLEKNTTGRFGIEIVFEKDKEQSFGMVINENYRIGFENPADATMYTMFFQ